MAGKQATSQRVTSDFVVEVKNLHRIYQMGDVQVPALNGVDLQIRHGEFVVILGVSGSGKSTLLNLLGGLDRPTEGNVLIEGQDLSLMNDDQLADVRLKQVGFVFQFFNLMPQLTAQANVELPLFLAEIPSKRAQERSEELLKLVGLTPRAHHRPTELSGGEQQRVAIARALANSPTIVLADEPTGNLDTKTGGEIIKLLREVNQTKHQTFIVVGHDKRLKTVADRIIEMQDGRFIRKQRKRGQRNR